MVTQSTQQLRKPLGLNGEMFRRALFDSFVKLNPLGKNALAFNS